MCSTKLEENEEINLEKTENQLAALRKILKAFTMEKTTDKEEKVAGEITEEEKELLDMIGSVKLED